MSAVRRPLALENFHIFTKGQCENTFKYVAAGKSRQHRKNRKYFPDEQALCGILQAKIRIIFRGYPLRTQWALFCVDCPILGAGQAVAPGCGGSHFVSRHRWLRPAFEPFNFDLIFVSLQR